MAHAINDAIIPRSVGSVVIYCSTNSINTNSTYETSLGILVIAESISKRHPNIEIIVTGLLPRDIN